MEIVTIIITVLIINVMIIITVTIIVVARTVVVLPAVGKVFSTWSQDTMVSSGVMFESLKTVSGVVRVMYAYINRTNTDCRLIRLRRKM